MTDGVDTTTAAAHILESGGDEEVRMLLGDRDRIRFAGMIRAGKQVPIKDCTDAEKKLFLELEAQGIPYDEVNRKMGGKPKSRDSKLTMVNTDHFVLRSCDFKKPSDCEFILKNYSDSDGHVRRIPVFFTVSSIEQAIPHGFKAFNGSNQLRCVSFYDGDVMKFRYLPKSVTAPTKTDWLILESQDEDEATKACGYAVTFSGLFIVNVKGLRGIGPCVISSKTWNGFADSVAILKRIKSRLGRFDGLLNGEHMFELCKVQEYVQHAGKRVKQQIVTLELCIDPMEIERYREPQQVAARSLNALRQLTGHALNSGVAEASPLPSPSPTPVPAAVSEEQSPAPPECPEELKPAVAYIEKLAGHYNVGMAKLRVYFSSLHGGLDLEGATLDVLKAFTLMITKAAKEDIGLLCQEILKAQSPQ